MTIIGVNKRTPFRRPKESSELPKNRAALCAKSWIRMVSDTSGKFAATLQRQWRREKSRANDHRLLRLLRRFLDRRAIRTLHHCYRLFLLWLFDFASSCVFISHGRRECHIFSCLARGSPSPIIHSEKTQVSLFAAFVSSSLLARGNESVITLISSKRMLHAGPAFTRIGHDEMGSNV
jgi:hypothetical protein